MSAKIADTRSELTSEMKGQYDELAKTDVHKSSAAAEIAMLQIAAQAQKPPEVSLDDINKIKKMIFEIKDFTMQTDNFVRENVLSKIELNNTAVEDVGQ